MNKIKKNLFTNRRLYDIIQSQNAISQLNRWRKIQMDAIKFIEERNRMCKSFGDGCGCQMCPACDNDLCCSVSIMSTLDAAKQVAIVEKWSVEHPRKTRQDVFLEQYPEANLDERGVLNICPLCVSSAYRNSNASCKYSERTCSNCRREFWMQEVE